MATFYLAPLEGITTYVYRNAFKKYYGGIDRYFTPFLTASHLKGREKREVDPENNQGIEVVPQILTNDSSLFVTISKQLAELGYSEVNLNLGCPSGTVVSKGRGAGFLDKIKELDIFMDEIFDQLPNMKISVKTRIGVEFDSEWDDILEIYKKYPIKELIVHPRLRNDFYDGQVRLEAFAKAIPDFENLCYNGDIVDVDSYIKISTYIKEAEKETARNQSFPEVYMIGRGVIANPELPGILREFEGEKTFDSDRGNIDKKKLRAFLGDIVDSYLIEMANEKQVVMKMKELWTYLAKGLDLSVQDIRAIHKTSRLADYKSVEQMILLR